MEMPGRRSNYALLSQNPDEPFYPQPPPKQPKVSVAPVAQQPLYYESHSGEKNKLKSGRAGAFDAIDQRMIQGQPQPQQSRIATAPFLGSFGLQRQSSESSFGESSLSGDYYVPSLSNPDVGISNLSDGVGEFRAKATEVSFSGGDGSSSSKSWALQTEESYQLQLALALRLSSEATCADDPNFLDPVPDEAACVAASSPASAEAISHRYWINGCLSYFDRIPDGFYMIHGMDPYVWTVCSDHQESGRIPSFESLRTVDPAFVSSVEVISVDRRGDPSLKELQNRTNNLSSCCITTKEVVEQLAKLVCNHMGDASSNGEDNLVTPWKECSDELKDCLGSVVLPIGSLSIGLCQHRTLLFKVLADDIGLPCRIARGCKYCTRENASSCLVRFGLDREYLVDLVEKPGCLYEPDSLLNGPSTISISSPLRFPRFRQVEPPTEFRLLAKQFFSEIQSLNSEFGDFLAGGTANKGGTDNSMHPKQSEGNYMDRTSCLPSSSNREEISITPQCATNSWIKVHGLDQLLSRPSDIQEVMSSSNKFKHSIPLKLLPPTGHENPQIVPFMNPRMETSKNARFGEGGQLVPCKSSEYTFYVDDLNIPWSDLVLKEIIGAGSFGTVHRAEWNGCDVAVKILMEQDFHAERFKEFLQEVAIMKRLRHPNIVLFMGAVTEPPNLSIVTEYLSRGSLYRLLHKPGAREALDEKRRLSMAYDVAKGMNYLHKRNPPVVHRDLKSPNLLVDRKYTVKVCDFGLSRLKANTFLSSKSAAGTPEWMAPEVLRDEPSNEKSDVYSFGVILWELATLQQPWGNLNPAQVVAAVGFKGKRLEIPRDVNPEIAALIEACWAKESWKRPSFSTIMESLRPLIKYSPPTQPDWKSAHMM
ncbi:serine/threonine-protein kinase CTR1 isoform X2 [Salvia miltiorrhiza]|uniref:serine/threonine-protein kinase CTR1 isoform X2 n=1 Tax=Salvia miltiorrhiza TaxID=226208 RepID=UPI0025AC9DDE|nr:serine/threonine-protein kinase CTR1 isoform X2 [Salvia miltiorrhiza]XP_057779365.1 serine/threonine-protein kinase CTR1 isoform X2 [Salvia miltiorrhiza]